MLCYALGEKREQGAADGALGHGHPEVFRNGGPDDGKAVLIRQPASRHARRPRQQGHRFPGVVGAGVGGVVAVVRREQEQVFLFQDPQ